MELKEGYKMTEVGEIPEDWNTPALEDVSQVIGGGTPSTQNKEFWNGAINWFTPSEIGKSKYVAESLRKITEKGLRNSSAKLLPVGSVLLTTRATIGELAITTEPSCTNQGFQSLVLRENVNLDFLYYVLCRRKNDFLRNASGSTFLEISPQKVKKTKVPFPRTYCEQTAIATTLSDIDTLIARTEKLIEKKRAIKQGMMQQLLSPYDMEGRLKDGWIKKKFTEIVDYVHGKAHEQHIVDDGKFIVANSKFISSDGEVKKYSNHSFLTAKSNDILTVLSDLPNGKALAKCYFVDCDNRYAVNQRICIWRSKGADPLFLYYLLNRHEYFLQLDDGVTQTHILNGDIERFEIDILDNKNEQIRIGKIFKSIENEMNSWVKYIGKLQSLKQSMMQSLLTGKIRIYKPEYEPATQV
ncbi:restriction endonuclease subunit S [Chitinophaga japonensis]|uniref:Type I restriction enzyme S subunit n=1 Tax=Chitinophaga japonensis TaxID=104662 RepID=A0A562T657_CHIJA|nr:restriction endonuclease subunit S [Chitinophaga japonensis]TWI88566.1 type I restriction enzyme S subunit [Chitinophaga japonensis]